MGKGDMKTLRGKLFRGSYGKTRPQKESKPAKVAAPAVAKTRTTKK